MIPEARASLQSMNRKNKVVDSVDAVVADVLDGATIMFGGFRA
jgi:hypothetical protein